MEKVSILKSLATTILKNLQRGTALASAKPLFEKETSRLTLHPLSDMLNQSVIGKSIATIAVSCLTIPEHQYSLNLVYGDGIRCTINDAIVFEDLKERNGFVSKSLRLDNAREKVDIKIEHFSLKDECTPDVALVPVLMQLKETIAKRKANAAIAILKLGHQDLFWQCLKDNVDSRLRTLLIHRLGPLNADRNILINQLTNPDLEVRSAILLSLGEMCVRTSWVSNNARL